MKKRLRKKLTNRKINTKETYVLKALHDKWKFAVKVNSETIEMIEEHAQQKDSKGQWFYEDQELTMFNRITRKGKLLPITYGMVRKMK